jgi:hypothetical protein
MPGRVEGEKGTASRQHWIVVVFWGVVVRAGAVRYVVGWAEMQGRRERRGRRRRRMMMVFRR